MHIFSEIKNVGAVFSYGTHGLSQGEVENQISSAITTISQSSPKLSSNASSSFHSGISAFLALFFLMSWEQEPTLLRALLLQYLFLSM